MPGIASNFAVALSGGEGIIILVVILGAMVVTSLAWSSLTGNERAELGRGPSAARQRRNALAASERAQREDAEYASMTPAQRDEYYVHPSWRVRFKRFWKG